MTSAKELPSGFSPRVEAAADADPGFLAELRQRGRTAFNASGLPHRREEAWRLTPLKSITDLPFVPAAAAPTSLPDGLAIAGARRLVFVNGRFEESLSDLGTEQSGVTLSPLSRASAAVLTAAEARIPAAMSVGRNAFAALNGALAEDGAVVHVAANTTVDDPIQLVFVTEAAGEPTAAYPRVMVVVESGARAVVVENHLGRGTTLACPVTELVVDDGAELEHVLVEEVGDEGRLVTSLGARLGTDSRLNSHAIAMDGVLIRNNVVVSLTGENGLASLHGLCLPDGRQHMENHLRMEHLVPNCESHQLYRGILDDQSRVAFTGLILVAEDAQKTDANQANHSLLLSERAVVNSNPQLEIFADDVKCTHGSTVGELDEDALFYLRSRGIGRAEAQGILTFGFASDLLEKLPVPALAERLEALLVERLPGGTGSGR